MNEKAFNFKEIKLIVGLGNLGDQFVKTRHNIGFMFIDELSEFDLKEEKKFESMLVAIQTGTHKMILSKPTTMMNNSGRSVNKIMQYFNIDSEEILVVHDDLDIELGEFKIQFDKGPKAHNGIISIESTIGTSKFWRLRLGVDSRDDLRRKNQSGADYVLDRVNTKEMEIILNTIKNIIHEHF